VLTTRPAGVDVVVVATTDAGLEPTPTALLPSLRALKPDDVARLAEAAAGQANAQTRRLADSTAESPLITVIGGGLWPANRSDPPRMRSSDAASYSNRRGAGALSVTLRKRKRKRPVACARCRVCLLAIATMLAPAPIGRSHAPTSCLCNGCCEVALLLVAPSGHEISGDTRSRRRGRAGAAVPLLASCGCGHDHDRGPASVFDAGPGPAGRRWFSLSSYPEPLKLADELFRFVVGAAVNAQLACEFRDRGGPRAVAPTAWGEEGCGRFSACAGAGGASASAGGAWS
jgi:hypothetical protein